MRCPVCLSPSGSAQLPASLCELCYRAASQREPCRGEEPKYVLHFTGRELSALRQAIHYAISHTHFRYAEEGDYRLVKEIQESIRKRLEP
jgi:hypothetical protein